VNLLPRTIEPKATVVIMHRAPRRKVVRQLSPRAAGASEVEDAVEYLTHVDSPMPTARLGSRDHRFDDRPLFIREVRWVGRPCHNLFIGLIGTYHTRSKLS